MSITKNLLSLNRLLTSRLSSGLGSQLRFSSTTRPDQKADTLDANQSRERSLNHVQLIGRVGQDPRVSNGDKDKEGKPAAKVVYFSLATNEYQQTSSKNNAMKDNADSLNTRTDWHRISIFSPKMQDNVEKYVRQGDRVYVSGRIHYNLIRDKAGDQRYITSIIADDIVFLTKFN